MGLAATGWVDVDDSARRRHQGGRPAALWQIAVIAEAFERAVRARMGRGAMSELSLAQLCEACTDVTSLKASIALVTEEGRHQAALAVSDGAAAVEELQFTLGEGPGVDAQAQGRAVLVDDLTLHATHWVHFVPAARARCACATR